MIFGKVPVPGINGDRMILVNQIKCKLCGSVIESTITHDFKTCLCGKVSVDGGHSYLRRCGDAGTWEELSIIKPDNSLVDPNEPPLEK